MALAALLLGVAGLSGCGQATGTVTGKVTYQGKPLPSGRITFLCQEGDKPALSSEIRNGEYKIADAPIGTAQITVETFAPRSFTPVPGMPANIAPPGSVSATNVTEGPGATPATPSGEYVAIPAKYKTAESSGLSHQVGSGPQTKDIELTP